MRASAAPRRSDSPSLRPSPGPDQRLPVARQQGVEPEGSGHEDVRRLQVPGHAEENGREQRPASRPRGEAGGDQEEAEDLRRGPDEVERGHGEEQQSAGHRQRRPGAHPPPPKHAEGEPEGGRQQDAVRDRQAARAERGHERGRDERMRERLRVVEPPLVGTHPPDPWEPGRPVHRQAAARPLQEDPLRAVRELRAHAGEVPRVEAQVVVAGQAPGHRVVGRPVAPELALRRAGQVEAQGRSHERHGREREDESGRQSHPASRYHAAVRAIPSSRSTFGA